MLCILLCKSKSIVMTDKQQSKIRDDKTWPVPKPRQHHADHAKSLVTFHLWYGKHNSNCYCNVVQRREKTEKELTPLFKSGISFARRLISVIMAAKLFSCSASSDRDEAANTEDIAVVGFLSLLGTCDDKYAGTDYL